jgi:O-antigen/teichoic acid export membrane protein
LVLPIADLSRYSLYTLISALIGFAISQADKIFTWAQQGLAELAIYTVAMAAASFVANAPYALLMVLLPAFSALHASGRKGEMRDMVRTYTRFVSIVVLPIAFGFASITNVVLGIFGPEYVAGFAPSVIVSVATGLTAIGAVYAGVLLALGELRWFTAANVLGLLGLILVSYFLTPIVGLRGPALGRACLMVSAAIVYAFATSRSGFLELDWKAYLSAVGGSTIMAIIVYYALTFAPSFLMKLALLPAVVVLGALVYLGSLRVLHLFTAQDMEFVRNIMPSRFHGLVTVMAKLAGSSSTD